jgi:hypothetical protein
MVRAWVGRAQVGRAVLLVGIGQRAAQAEAVVAEASNQDRRRLKF